MKQRDSHGIDAKMNEFLRYRRPTCNVGKQIEGSRSELGHSSSAPIWSKALRTACHFCGFCRYLQIGHRCGGCLRTLHIDFSAFRRQGTHFSTNSVHFLFKLPYAVAIKGLWFPGRHHREVRRPRRRFHPWPRLRSLSLAAAAGTAPCTEKASFPNCRQKENEPHVPAASCGSGFLLRPMLFRLRHGSVRQTRAPCG